MMGISCICTHGGGGHVPACPLFVPTALAYRAVCADRDAMRDRLEGVERRLSKAERDRAELREALSAFLCGHTSDERLAELNRPSNGSPFALGVRAMYHSGVIVEEPMADD